jgi:hypothetical protein
MFGRQGPTGERLASSGHCDRPAWNRAWRGTNSFIRTPLAGSPGLSGGSLGLSLLSPARRPDGFAVLLYRVAGRRIDDLHPAALGPDMLAGFERMHQGSRAHSARPDHNIVCVERAYWPHGAFGRTARKIGLGWLWHSFDSLSTQKLYFAGRPHPRSGSLSWEVTFEDRLNEIHRQARRKDRQRGKRRYSTLSRLCCISGRL